MKSLYIVGTKPKDHPFPILSYIIRLLTWSKISHVLVDFPLSGEVFHVYLDEIRFEDRIDYLKTVVEEYRIKVSLPDAVYDEFYEKCNPYVGPNKGYLWHLVGLAIALPFRALNIFIRNPFAIHYESKICSQMIAEIFVDVVGLFCFCDYGPYLENFDEMDCINVLRGQVGEHWYGDEYIEVEDQSINRD